MFGCLERAGDFPSKLGRARVWLSGLDCNTIKFFKRLIYTMDGIDLQLRFDLRRAVLIT